ncbi:MAG: 4-alpha-glucanotransferase, partial [Candidatus Angelobacter sp.]
MRFPRSSGILLHPTCLPGPHGIGEFGSEAFAFVDFLKDAGQKLWQVLPLNPTGYGDSPFQSFSAHAGNHLLISLERLREQGILDASDFTNEPEFPEDHVEFGSVIPWKTSLLKKAAQRFLSDNSKEKQAFDEFRATNAGWLSEFALFMA